jgi:hypothetical protein
MVFIDVSFVFKRTKFITEPFFTVTTLLGSGAVIFCGVTADCPTGAVVPVVLKLVLFAI